MSINNIDYIALGKKTTKFDRNTFYTSFHYQPLLGRKKKKKQNGAATIAIHIM